MLHSGGGPELDRWHPEKLRFENKEKPIHSWFDKPALSEVEGFSTNGFDFSLGDG
jgi:hypothetical protein